ncbi:MAG: hypothetical protein WDN06_16190 [Asticcacaulis sp.]
MTRLSAMSRDASAKVPEKERQDSDSRQIRALLYDAAGHDEDIDPSALPVKAFT